MGAVDADEGGAHRYPLNLKIGLVKARAQVLYPFQIKSSSRPLLKFKHFLLSEKISSHSGLAVLNYTL